MNSPEGEVIWQIDWGTASQEPHATPPEPIPPLPVLPVSQVTSATISGAPSPSPQRHTVERLVRGQRINLADLNAGLAFEVLTRLEVPPGLVVDFACLGIDGQDRLSDDRYFVFYNQRQSPCGGMILDPGGEPATGNALHLQLAKLPVQISRLIVIAAIDGDGTASDLGAGSVTLQSVGESCAEFAFAGRDFGQEKVLMLIEFYRKGGAWRVATLGQGFSGGLAALLQHHGASVV